MESSARQRQVPEGASRPERVSAWLIAGDPSDVQAIHRRLSAPNIKFNSCFIGASDGRRYAADCEMLILAVDPRERRFEVFVADDPASGLVEQRHALVASAFARGSVRTATESPRDLVFLQFSPFGRRKFRRSQGRSVLDQTFESLKCVEILNNRYLQERLARRILSSIPRSADPIVSAIFSRMRADALRRLPSAEPGDLEAASLYRAAAENFQKTNLDSFATECARRARRTLADYRSSQQLPLPGFGGGERARAPAGLGLATRACTGIPLTIDLPKRDLSFPKLDSHRRRYAGTLALSQAEVDRLAVELEDPVQRPSVSIAPLGGAGDQARKLRLTVELQSEFASRIGSGVPTGAQMPLDENLVLSISSKTCSISLMHAALRPGAPAIFVVTPGAARRHRIDLILNGKDRFECFRADFSTDDFSVRLQDVSP